ncbi:MAG TPA: PH domain-containing protein [Patescibacteria group bacterium]|nr:PH domain-containing protein [Patescibacteria group bacterium]
MTDKLPKARRGTGKPRPANNQYGDILQAGEEVRMRAVISPGIYWRGFAVLGLAILMLIKAFNLGLFLLLVSMIILMFAQATKYYLLLLLTDKRVIIRFGILNLETIQFHYNKIETVEVAWPPMGRLLGYGSVFITGTGSRVISVPYVGNAREIRTAIDNLITRQEEKPMKVEITPPSTPPPGTGQTSS